MNKQILFATGGTHRADGVIVLTPEDKPVLALVSRLKKKHTESKQHKTKGRDTWDYYAWRGGLSIKECDRIGDFLKTRIPEVYDYGYHNYLNGETMRISSTHTYRFYSAELVDALQKLYTQVASLPSKVDDDQYQATDGRILSVANNYLRLQYTIPFDHAAWEARHKKNAEVDTADAEAKRKQAEADQAEADAQRAAQKARLMKTLRVALVALAIATVVVVLALIIKKK